MRSVGEGEVLDTLLMMTVTTAVFTNYKGGNNDGSSARNKGTTGSKSVGRFATFFTIPKSRVGSSGRIRRVVTRGANMGMGRA